jgi:hypothetical protein
MSDKTLAEGNAHLRYLLAAEHVRCVTLVENCDRELEKAREALKEWEAERGKWARRALAIENHLGEVPNVPRRTESELTEAWEFDTQ